MGRRVIVAFAVALIALAVGAFIQLGWLQAAPSHVSAVGGMARAIPVASGRVTIAIVDVQGEAERRRADGSWETIDASSSLAADDVIRTGEGATMELSVGPSVLVRVAEATELTLGEVSRSLSRIELADGRLASVVDADSGYRVRVEVRDSDAAAESDGGAFSILSRSRGPVAVAASAGTVSLSSGGEEVKLRSGELSVAERGQAPSAPEPVPTSLFLKLAQGVSVGPGQAEVEVVGTTVPGAVVRVAERSTSSRGGAFKQRVVLREGQNAITVEVEDALGRRAVGRVPVVRRMRSATSPAEVPRGPPPVDARVSW